MNDKSRLAWFTGTSFFDSTTKICSLIESRDYIGESNHFALVKRYNFNCIIYTYGVVLEMPQKVCEGDILHVMAFARNF